MANNNITIENARIGFRNFSGAEGRFNPKGQRNFCVFLDYDLAHVLEEDGWNVKYLSPRDEDESPQAYLQVKVYFNTNPEIRDNMQIVLISHGKKTRLNEDTISILDWAEIENVDLIIRPYDWEVSGKTGRKAYLKSIYVTLKEDELESKYYDIPDSARSSIEED